MTSLASDFDEVFNAELQEIGKRRKKQGIAEVEAQDGSPNHKSSLVGVALSGGGVRSAGVNLGILQHLYKSGFLRLVDYQSTVSGGGYAGALVSSEIASDSDGINWERNGKENRLSIEPTSEVGQPTIVYELAMYGRRMGDLVKLLSRHLYGWIMTILFFLSGVVCIASLVSWVMRLPWTDTGLALLPGLGFTTDIHRAFFPAFLAFLFWLFTVFLSRFSAAFKWRLPPFAKLSYLMLIGSIALGFLTLIAIGDIGIEEWIRIYQLPESWSVQLNHIAQFLGATIAAGLSLTLLPYLAPKALLNSGARQGNLFQKAVFNLAGYGLLFGVPLFVFFFLSKEDLANHNREVQTSGILTKSHLKDLEHFLDVLENHETDTSDKRLLNAVINPPETDANAGQNDLEQWRFVNALQQSAQNRSFRELWTDFLAATLISRDAGSFWSEYRNRRENTELARLFAQRITEQCLTNPGLFAFTDKTGTQLQLDGKPFKEIFEKGWIEARLAAEGESAAEHEKRQDAVTGKAIQIIQLQAESKKTLEEFCLQSPNPNVVAFLEDSDNSRFLQQIAKPNAAQLDGRTLVLLQESLKRTRALLEGERDIDRNYLSWVVSNHACINKLVAQTRLANFAVLRAKYPKHFADTATIYAAVVNTSDQSRRLRIAFGAALVFLFVGSLTNVNTTSLHGVYRDELADVWLPSRDFPLHKLDACRNGGPFHLINCTLNHLSSAQDPDAERRSRFVMSHRFCGSSRTGYRETQHYQNGKLTVADAIAISGAAVTPTAANNVLYRLLLMLTNFRLGQWLQNPARYEVDSYWPSPLRTAANLLWDPQERSLCFVSDGGHLDNTGLSSLLERRCRLMICIDASDDGPYDFEDLMHVMQASRAKYGLDFLPLDMFRNPPGKSIDVFDLLRPDERGFSSHHFVAMRVKYPARKNQPAFEGLLVFAKSTMTGDEPIDMLELKRRCREFPHDPTSNQFMAPERFEAYVTLGRHIATAITQFLQKGDFEEARLLPQHVNDWRKEFAVEQQPPTVAKAADPVPEHGHRLPPDSPFNEANIDVACQMLQEWEKSALIGVDPDPLLTDVSNWARDSYWVADHDEDDHIHLRQVLCSTLLEIVQRNKARVTASTAAREVFITLLTVFGRGIRGVRTGIHELIDGHHPDDAGSPAGSSARDN